MAVENISYQRRFNMPAAPRLKGKATKIAFKVLGTPANLQFKRNRVQRMINRRLVFEETS